MDRSRILIVDDDEALREGLVETVGQFGHQALEARDGIAALAIVADRPGAIAAVLLDLRMPGAMDGMETLRRIRDIPGAPPVAVVTAYASAENTIEAMRIGAFDHLTKPIGRAELSELIERMIAARTMPPAADEIGPPQGAFIGMSDAMRRVQKQIGLAADSNATVLVVGETGTGKEMIARALHGHSTERRNRAFVAINTAAIPSELLESELFGHVKGAFTGAVADRSGAFRDADGGTLLLDEIGDMPLSTQAKLLRVIQERTVTPVGGRPVRVDVRLVAATHRDLHALVAAERFRADLFYRLNVVPIVLPPLRERRDDIMPLAEHFLSRTASGAPKYLTAEAATRLTEHPWPGNVRELRNVLERASVMVRGAVIDAADLDLDAVADREPAPVEDWLSGDLASAVARLERTMILNALTRSGGNRAAAARALGIHRQQLYAKIERYGLGEDKLSV